MDNVDGNLVGSSCFLPRHPNDEKVTIPSDICSSCPQIQWHMDTVKGQGMEFTHVEISATPIAIVLPDTTIVTTKRQGRPTVKPEGCEGMAEIMNSHVIQRGLFTYASPGFLNLAGKFHPA